MKKNYTSVKEFCFENGIRYIDTTGISSLETPLPVSLGGFLKKICKVNVASGWWGSIGNFSKLSEDPICIFDSNGLWELLLENTDYYDPERLLPFGNLKEIKTSEIELWGKFWNKSNPGELCNYTDYSEDSRKCMLFYYKPLGKWFYFDNSPEGFQAIISLWGQILSSADDENIETHLYSFLQYIKNEQEEYKKFLEECEEEEEEEEEEE